MGSTCRLARWWKPFMFLRVTRGRSRRTQSTLKVSRGASERKALIVLNKSRLCRNQQIARILQLMLLKSLFLASRDPRALEQKTLDIEGIERCLKAHCTDGAADIKPLPRPGDLRMFKLMFFS